MRRTVLENIAILLLTATASAWATSATSAEIVFVGKIAIPGNARDKSGLKDILSDGTPHNRFGSFGSAIAYTGEGNRYLMLADRGPVDGKAAYYCRFHEMDIELKPGNQPLKAKLRATTLLKDENGRQLVGAATAFDPTNPTKMLRFDPEGIRVSPNGTLFISDEYGPFIYEFDRRGRRLRSLKVPDKFLIQHPKADPAEELKANTKGRMPNRGFEGLAILPDGSKLLAAMQSPLIQDGNREGTNVRLLELDVKSGGTREFLYPLENKLHGLTEILALNATELLVLERDHRSGHHAQFKQIIKINTCDATDISSVEALPATGLPPGVKAVSKTTFLNLLSPRYGLLGRDFPEKIEGLAFGPDLPDGRHLLLVSSDNDFIETAPTYIYAFVIGVADLPGYRPQVFRP